MMWQNQSKVYMCSLSIANKHVSMISWLLVKPNILFKLMCLIAAKYFICIDVPDRINDCLCNSVMLDWIDVCSCKYVILYMCTGMPHWIDMCSCKYTILYVCTGMPDCAL